MREKICVKCGRKHQSKTTDQCIYCRRETSKWKKKHHQVCQSVTNRPIESRTWGRLTEQEAGEHMSALVRRLTDLPIHGPVKIYTAEEIAEYQRHLHS